jgi:hypothetical protein
MLVDRPRLLGVRVQTPRRLHGQRPDGAVERDQRLRLQVLGPIFVAQRPSRSGVLHPSGNHDESDDDLRPWQVDPDVEAVVTEPGLPPDRNRVRGVDREPMDVLIAVGLRDG